MSAALYINECCFCAAAQGDFIVEGSECMSADSVNHRLHIKINKEVLVNVGIGDKFRSMGERLYILWMLSWCTDSREKLEMVQKSLMTCNARRANHC